LYQRFAASHRQNGYDAQSIVEALQKKGRASDADSVKVACSSREHSICECAASAAPIALSQDLGVQSLELLKAALSDCSANPLLRGLQSEALARTGHPDEALTEAVTVLRETAQSPYATYAMAQAHFSKGDLVQARNEATQAVQNGRGTPAYLLLGLIDFRNNDIQGALAEFEKLLSIDPKDVAGNFNRAFMLHRLNRYHDAREAYLAVIQLDPMNLDARFNLGLLAHSIGADDEARHHLEKLSALAPQDVRVAQLTLALNAPKAEAPTTLPKP
jgi:tetratricopeptide (TPR) repeat protein